MEGEEQKDGDTALGSTDRQNVEEGEGSEGQDRHRLATHMYTVMLRVI